MQMRGKRPDSSVKNKSWDAGQQSASPRQHVLSEQRLPSTAAGKPTPEQLQKTAGTVTKLTHSCHSSLAVQRTMDFGR